MKPAYYSVMGEVDEPETIRVRPLKGKPPRLYHLTDMDNLPAIQRKGLLPRVNTADSITLQGTNASISFAPTVSKAYKSLEKPWLNLAILELVKAPPVVYSLRKLRLCKWYRLPGDDFGKAQEHRVISAVPADHLKLIGTIRKQLGTESLARLTTSTRGVILSRYKTQRVKASKGKKSYVRSKARK